MLRFTILVGAFYCKERNENNNPISASTSKKSEILHKRRIRQGLQEQRAENRGRVHHVLSKRACTPFSYRVWRETQGDLLHADPEEHKQKETGFDGAWTSATHQEA